jgi:protein-S-isoprenylcysteine O-methyltransferase Ste14
VETYAPALLRPAAAGVFWAVWLAVIGAALWPARPSHRGSLLVLATSIAAAGALAAAATAALCAAGLGDGWLWYGVGVALIVAGGAVRAWSVRSAASPASGPYRLVRYPGYTGTLLALAGFGLGLDNLVALLAAVVVPLPALAYRIAIEERAIPAAHGRTARLIPGVW